MSSVLTTSKPPKFEEHTLPPATHNAVEIYAQGKQEVVDPPGTYGYSMAKRLGSFFCAGSKKLELLGQLASAKSSSEWQSIADQIDLVTGNRIWREDALDDEYDHKLIFGRLCELRAAREAQNVPKLAALVRSGSLRNLGSICGINLYNHAYGGTKCLIEEYIAETVRSVEFLAGYSSNGKRMTKAELQKKLEYFHDTSQSLGRSALVLHGGTLFGLCHLGAVKSLLMNELLPPVIGGVSVGAAVAALCCSVPDNELGSLISSVPQRLPELIDELYGTEYMGGVASSVFRTLVPPEVQLFVNYVKGHLDDQTFEELFARSGRILNITVLPERLDASGKVAIHTPSFIHCNYLTTPKMLVRSAMFASIGSNSLPLQAYGDTFLLVKDYKGNVVVMENSPAKFRPANQQPNLSTRKSPYVQLAELFNVNNFVVSIARPYLAPVLLSDFKNRGQKSLWQTGVKLFRTVLTYRLQQLSALRLLPQLVQRILVDEAIHAGFQVNIVPEPESLLRDAILLLDSNNTGAKAQHWIELGERSVWPLLSILRARMTIELALGKVYDKTKSYV